MPYNFPTAIVRNLSRLSSEYNVILMVMFFHNRSFTLLQGQLPRSSFELALSPPPHLSLTC